MTQLAFATIPDTDPLVANDFALNDGERMVRHFEAVKPNTLEADELAAMAQRILQILEAQHGE